MTKRAFIIHGWDGYPDEGWFPWLKIELEKNGFQVHVPALRYLESLPADKKVAGAAFVAGWFTLMNLKTDEEKEIAKPWLETPIDFDKVKQHTKKFFAVFSDNDDVVPQENKKLFSERLGAKTAMEHARGHFSGGDGVKELPIVLEAILSL